jgi:two-component system invasion response regulator UvrY
MRDASEVPIRVLVVDDHDGFRSALVGALSLMPQVEVAGAADSGERACDAVLALRPDVVLMDVSLPGMDGISATRRIRRSNPDTSVVVLTSFDGGAVERSAREAGARAVIGKGAPLDDVVMLILEAAEQSPNAEGPRAQ